jgi:hypothetical protein
MKVISDDPNDANGKSSAADPVKGDPCKRPRSSAHPSF